MTLNPWLGMVLVATALAGCFAALRLYQLRSAPHPELVRKLLHVMMGLVTLSFPWLFAEPWPVVVLAVTTIAGLLILKNRRALRQQWGDVLHGVSRSSFGEIYFPASVALLFVLSGGDALLFCIPILILTLADALAALIGVRYGQMQYKTSEGHKSLEGSVVFFTIAFLSVHVPLLLFSDVGRTESLLIGLIMGLLVMLFEAIAWRGLDNLFIPLGAFILLQTYLPMTGEALLPRLLVILFLLLAFYLARHKTTLDDGAILGAVLIAYLTWAIGGLVWLVAPCTVLVAYAFFSRQANQQVGREHPLQAVAAAGMPGLICLFLAKELNQPLLFYCYTLAYAVQLALIGLIRIKQLQPDLSDFKILTRAIWQGWSLLFVPFMVIEAKVAAFIFSALAALLMVLATTLFLRWQPIMDDYLADNSRWWRQGSVPLATALLSSVPLWIFGEVWRV